MSKNQRKIHLASVDLDEIPLHSTDYTAAELRSILRSNLERTLGSNDQARQDRLRNRILELDLSHEAVQAFEASSILNGALSDREKNFSPEQKRRIRYWYARILSRAGYYLHGKNLISKTPPQTPAEFLISGYFKIAFGELENGLYDYEAGYRIQPNYPTIAGSYFHSLMYMGDLNKTEVALRSLTELRSSNPEGDQQGFYTARISEALRLLGRSDQAQIEVESFLRKLDPAFQRPHATLRTQVLHLLHERASNFAALGDTAKSRAAFDEVLTLSLGGKISYPNLIFLFRRISMAKIARDAESHLLMALSRFLPETDSRRAITGEFCIPLNSAKKPPHPGTWAIDLGRNELWSGDEKHPYFGIPLEARLLAWIALASHPLHALSPSLHHSVRRSLLMDILWREAPAPISALDARLTKLLKRVESEYQFNIRNEESKTLYLGPSEIRKLTLNFSSTPLRPSYFDQTRNPCAPGFSTFYGLSPSQGRVVFKTSSATFGSGGASGRE